jgi:glycosyltransferase involved in cell wall biosynthesis
MRRLKIVLLSRRYWEENHFGDEEGGATQQLAEAVAAMGHEVIVLSQSPEVRKLKKISIGHLETWVSPRNRQRSLVVGVRDRLARKRYFQPHVFSDVLALRDFLAKRGPFDVLWAHAETPDGLTAALAARRKIKLPPMLVQIQHLPCRYVKGAPVFTEKLPLDLAFRQASRILASSELVVTALPKYASPGHSAEDLRAKVRVVYPNIQRAFIRDAEESPDVPAPMKDRVLFLGSLNQHKGALVFLRAIAKTEAAKRNAIFAVAGDFTEYNKRFIQLWEETKETTRINLPGARMEYLGHVSTLEVIRQIKLARVVVVPYRFDAFARGLVEALVLGRPVITTDQVGASSLVNTHQCGIVVPPNDPGALAHAIDVVLSPVVPFADNAQRVGHSLSRELAPEAIAPYISYHLSRIAAPEK